MLVSLIHIGIQLHLRASVHKVASQIIRHGKILSSNHQMDTLFLFVNTKHATNFRAQADTGISKRFIMDELDQMAATCSHRGQGKFHLLQSCFRSRKPLGDLHAKYLIKGIGLIQLHGVFLSNRLRESYMGIVS